MKKKSSKVENVCVTRTNNTNVPLVYNLFFIMCVCCESNIDDFGSNEETKKKLLNILLARSPEPLSHFDDKFVLTETRRYRAYDHIRHVSIKIILI